MIDDIEKKLSGTCNYFDIEEESEKLCVDELGLAMAMDEAGIYMCNICGWWTYPGESCSEHDHDEIICTDCCDIEENEE